jgi:hypothetical protein
MSEEIFGVSKGKAERAISDWPQTEVRHKSEGVWITGRYRQPQLADRLIFVAGIICAAGTGLGIYGTVQTDNGGWFLGLTIAGLFLALLFYLWGARKFRRNLAIRIFPDRIDVDGRSYTKDENIEFRVQRHHKAADEERRERLSGKRAPSTYRHAIEVVMQYGERRIVIAEMHQKDEEKARALVIRLQNWIDDFGGMLVKQVRTHTAAAPEPIEADEFGPAPPIR